MKHKEKSAKTKQSCLRKYLLCSKFGYIEVYNYLNASIPETQKRKIMENIMTYFDHDISQSYFKNGTKKNIVFQKK